MLVRVPIKMRGLTAKSQTLTREAADTHEGDRDSFSAGVKLFGVDPLSPIIRIVNMARAFHIENTLPWADTGFRLIPVERLPYWQRELTRMQGEFMDAVDGLIAAYPRLRKDYIRRVNDVAQEIPFPTLEQLKGNFDFDLMMQPIANPNDLRLKHIDPKTVAELKAKAAADMSAILDEGHKDIINRLFKVVNRIHEQTSSADGRLFRSLVGNLEEAVDVLPKLNLRNDPEIKRLINRVRTELSSIDLEALKTNGKRGDVLKVAQTERAKTAKAASSILSDIKSYGKPVRKAAPVVVKNVKAPVAAVASGRKSAFANIDL